MIKHPFLPASKHLLAKGFQLALILSPLYFSAAPARAEMLTRTFSGFEGAFAPASWTTTNQGGNAAAFTTTTLSLFKNIQVGTTAPKTSYLLNKTLFETTYKPLDAGSRAVKFLGGTLSYDWTWSTASAVGNSSSFYNFQATVDSIARTKYSPNTGTSAAGSDLFSLTPTSNFEFAHTRTGSTAPRAASGVISNFQFVANYVTVPGPLPLAGAAAAFAWSRRLRNRLNSTQATS
jgi:hypothetical protein